MGYGHFREGPGVELPEYRRGVEIYALVLLPMHHPTQVICHRVPIARCGYKRDTKENTYDRQRADKWQQQRRGNRGLSKRLSDILGPGLSPPNYHKDAKATYAPKEDCPWESQMT